jgi:oligosaccharide repeat unit polymerase
VVLGLLCAVGGLFYPVGPDGIYIYMIGAFSYSIGALFVWFLPKLRMARVSRTPDGNRRTGKAFLILLLSIVAALPFLIVYTRAQAYNSSSDSFWTGVRSSYIEQNDLPGGGTMGVANLAPIYIVLAFIAVLELTVNPRYRRTLLTFFGLVFLFQLVLVARSNIMQLLVGAVAICAIRRGRLPVRVILLSVLLFLFVFGLNQFVLGKLDSNWSGPTSAKAASFGRGSMAYTVGPLVAFDDVISHPHHVLNTWKVYKPFVRLANKFGAGLPELSQHLDYTEIAPGLVTNVYTFYFTYYADFGIPGIIVASVLFGALSTVVYRMARQNSPMGIVLYALVVYGVIMSTFAECVCLEVFLWLKAAISVTFFYYLLPSTSVTDRYPRRADPLSTTEACGPPVAQ